MTENKSYYAILPANVRYDQDLTPNAKLLYAEITALTNETGYCWATNNYFAQLYNVTQNSITNWVKQLADKKYITYEIVYKDNTKEILGRYIKLFGDPTQNILDTPTQKICDNNNKELNNTLNIKENIKRKRFEKPTLEEVEAYCKERENNINAQSFIDFYESKGWKVGNQPMKDWKACVRTWEHKNQEREKEQIKNNKQRFDQRTYSQEEFNSLFDNLSEVNWK